MYEKFFKIPLVLKDYKDLIPEDYDNKESVEGVAFFRDFEFSKNFGSKWIIYCYKLPYRIDSTMELLSTPIVLEIDLKKPNKEKVDEALNEFYNKYIKDNIAGLHRKIFELRLFQISEEIKDLQADFKNLVDLREEFGIVV